MCPITQLNPTEGSIEQAFLALLVWQLNTDLNKKETSCNSPWILNAQLTQKEINLKVEYLVL